MYLESIYTVGDVSHIGDHSRNRWGFTHIFCLAAAAEELETAGGKQVSLSRR
jgi:hypothetical protein